MTDPLRRSAVTAAQALALRGVLALGALALVASQAFSAPLTASGQLGFIGEWQLTADLEGGQNGQREFSGPYVLKHVGLCTHDGPEVKTGLMRLNLSASSARLTATLVIDKKECTYSARKSDGYDGVLSCPGQSPVPLVLRLTERVAGTASAD